MREVTGYVPGMLWYVKYELQKEEQRHPQESAKAKLQRAIQAVETDIWRTGHEILDRVFENLQQEEKDSFLKYIGSILFPAWYRGPPKERDRKLYDKGFLYHDDKEGIFQVVNASARQALLRFYLTFYKAETVSVR